MIFGIAGDPDRASVCRHSIAFGNRLFSIVGSLSMHCRTQDVEHSRDIGFIEDDNIIHTSECRDKLDALMFIENGPARIFDQAHGMVAVDGNDEYVTKSPRAFEVAQMTDMQNIEASVRKHHFLPCNERRQFFEPPKFHGYRHLNAEKIEARRA